jgi:hypothetical protein
MPAAAISSCPTRSRSSATVAIVSANLRADTEPDLALGIGAARPGGAARNDVGRSPPTPFAPSLLSPAQEATPHPARGLRLVRQHRGDYGLSQVESREVRDVIIDSGMETGLQEGMDIPRAGRPRAGLSAGGPAAAEAAAGCARVYRNR